MRTTDEKRDLQEEFGRREAHAHGTGRSGLASRLGSWVGGRTSALPKLSLAVCLVSIPAACGRSPVEGSGFATEGIEETETDEERDELDAACRLSSDDQTPANAVRHQCGGFINISVILDNSGFSSGDDYDKFYGFLTPTDPYETPDVMACCEPLDPQENEFDQPHHIACHDNAAQHVCNNLEAIIESMKVGASAAQLQDLSVLQALFDSEQDRQDCIDALAQGESPLGAVGIINADANNRRFASAFELTDPPYDVGTNRVSIEISSGSGSPMGGPGPAIYLPPGGGDPCASPAENLDEPYAGVGDGLDDFSLDPDPAASSTTPRFDVVGPNYSGGGPMEGTVDAGAPAKLRLENPASFVWTVKELSVRADGPTTVSNAEESYEVDDFQLNLAGPEEALPHSSNPKYFYFPPNTAAFLASGTIDGVPFIAPAVNSGWVAFTKKPTTHNPTPRFTMSTLPVEFVDPNGDTWHVDLVVKGWTE